MDARQVDFVASKALALYGIISELEQNMPANDRTEEVKNLISHTSDALNVALDVVDANFEQVGDLQLLLGLLIQWRSNEVEAR